jgi:hypothetical protein
MLTCIYLAVTTPPVATSARPNIPDWFPDHPRTGRLLRGDVILRPATTGPAAPLVQTGRLVTVNGSVLSAGHS